MPSQKREYQLLDRTWERVTPMLPPSSPQPKGGRPFADDKARYTGIVHQLRNANRWIDIPRQFPFRVTYWRRHPDWTRASVWLKVWKFVLAELAVARLLYTKECFSTPRSPSRERGQCIGPRTRTNSWEPRGVVYPAGTRRSLSGSTTSRSVGRRRR